MLDFRGAYASLVRGRAAPCNGGDRPAAYKAYARVHEVKRLFSARMTMQGASQTRQNKTQTEQTRTDNTQTRQTQTADTCPSPRKDRTGRLTAPYSQKNVRLRGINHEPPKNCVVSCSAQKAVIPHSLDAAITGNG